MNNSIPTSNIFHLLCNRDAIPANGTLGFSIDGRELFVVNKGEEYYAYLNRCPHLGLPLNWVPDRFLDAEGELIQCSNHGALFVVESGRCVAGPCGGQHLEKLATKVEANSIFIKLS